MSYASLLDKILTSTDHKSVSDIFFSPGLPPAVRKLGKLKYISDQKLESEDIEKIIHLTMDEKQKNFYREEFEIDYAYNHFDKYRYRVNAFRTVKGFAATLRKISTKIPEFQDLAAPPIILDLVKKDHGLILVTGPTGSGKSTTLAAIINFLNKYTSKHIISIEDPVEFIFESKQSIINQRQLESNTKSFERALRSALREDPDVIMVGEMRDPETIRLALTAAETGHLVLSTLHTNTAYDSINRIIDIFPAETKKLAVTLLSSSLIGIVSQRLIATKDAKSMVAAHEILVATSAVRNLIREGNIPQIASMMQVGQKFGMITMQDSIQSLVSRGLVNSDSIKKLIKQVMENEEN
jgi:twitching motility protein PilT